MVHNLGAISTAGPAQAANADSLLDKLAGTVVKVNRATLSYASPTQINAYLPLDAPPEVLISTLEDGYI